MSKHFLVLLVVGIVLSSVAWSARAEEPADDAGKGDAAALPRVDELSELFRKVAKQALPSVVSISSVTVMEAPSLFPPGFGNDPFFRRFFGLPERRKYSRRGLGSGVIIDKAGHVLTNNHVIAGGGAVADKITVTLADGSNFEGKVIGRDPLTDIALVKIDAKNLKAAALGNSDGVEVGDWVLAIGTPFGLPQTVTQGIISAKGRANPRIAAYSDFIQTTAVINPGNSGGPLVNMRNEVIAINTAIFSRSGGYMGIGFAIPINMARQVMDVLLKDGKVVRGFLGATMQSVTPAVVKEYGLKTDAGVLIRMVDKGGPAEKGGLKAGDVVTRFNGKTITDVADLRNKIAWTKPGTKVKLGLVRKGKKLDSVVTLGKRLAAVADKGAEPARPEGPAKPSRSAVFEKLGITARDMTAREARRLGHRLGEGVLITRVKAGSPAQKVGLVPGHLILKIGGKATRSVAELKTALADMDPKKGLRMLVKMGRSQVFIYMRGG